MFNNMPQEGRLYKNEICPTGAVESYALCGQIAPMLPTNIQALRKRKKGLSQTVLAESIGTTISMMGKIERGDRDLTSAWIVKLAEELGVKPYVLIAPPNLFPTESQLASMLATAQGEIEVGLSYADYPTAVASSLREQLLQFAGAGASFLAEPGAPANGHDGDAQSRRPTKKAARG